ncbi:hypothetical protein [Geobacter argillaceus]|uniref:Uncharacterized protein n=1 Tax=Geobacter argillaceus TaxID=345631 RepID=A0A562VJW4_9BACT|nr:hypothetical protein [Geobacter argillaceus]TWJ18037.1 hypothetical protein JN12_02798 [Geobacter argillaceus]
MGTVKKQHQINVKIDNEEFSRIAGYCERHGRKPQDLIRFSYRRVLAELETLEEIDRATCAAARHTEDTGRYISIDDHLTYLEALDRELVP